MGATYTRQSNFTDGDVITADLFNNEFDQLLATLASSTGHTHDGTAAEGGPITKLIGDTITLGTAAGDISLVFDGGSNDGTLKWMEDEDYFEFSDDVLIATNEKIQFRDTAIFINSSADGQLDLVADTEIQIAATTVDINGLVDISGNLTVGGDLSVAGTTSFSGGTLNLGDGAGDSVVFGADVNSSIIPNTDSTFDLGSTTQEWRDLFLDGTAHIDTLDVDVNATVAGTLGVTGIATFTDNIIIGDGKTIGSTSDVDAITIAANGQLTLTQTLIGTALDISGDIDVDGVTNLDVVDIDGAVNMATTALVTGVLTTTATQVATGGITSGSNIVSDTDSTDDLGTTSVRWANLFVDGITATDQITATGFTGTLDGILGSGAAAAATVTSLNTSGVVNLNLTTDSTSSTSGALIVDGGVGVAKKLFVGTDLDVNGTTNLDVVDIDGAVNMATTALVTGVLTTTAATVFNGGFASNADSTMGTDKKLIFRDSAIHISSTADGDMSIAADDEIDLTSTLIDINGNVEISGTTTQTGVITANAGVVVDEMTLDADTLTATDDFILDVAGDVEINADGGTITFKDASSSLGTITSSGYSGTAAVATTVTITDNESTNENNAIIFAAGADQDGGNIGLESDGTLTYNPSTGTLNATNISVTGTLSTVDSVTMSANNAVVFEGATADAHETTLTVVDPTADRTITLPNQSGTVPVLAVASNTAVTSTPEELNALDGITAVVGELNALDIGSTAVGTAVASKAVILDSNKDYTGIRNLTITGELDAATLDISGAIDVAGTSNLDVVDIDGAVDMAQTLQVDGIATFSAVPVANAGLSVKNGSTSGGFIQFFESGGTSNLKVIAPALAADATLTLPAVAGTIATVAAAIDEATALAIALG